MKHRIAFLVYGNQHSARNALKEEKYAALADAFNQEQYTVDSVLYSDDQTAKLSESLQQYHCILVWVNPVEQGNDRRKLDLLLAQLSAKGILISTHPEVILKMGTKDILYKTKDMDWGGDTFMYTTMDQFKRDFPSRLHKNKIRVLKKYRGNGGNGVFKIEEKENSLLKVTHAIGENESKEVSFAQLFADFEPFFCDNGLLIDQPWNKNIANGMVRCYLCGTKVAGFGYQEINALYELKDDPNPAYIPPGKRFYFTENCGLFGDLRTIMEDKWIPEVQRKLELHNKEMPVIWDADFFINSFTGSAAKGKYSLCEINVSCVSPFPPSAIKFIVAEVAERLSP